MKKVKDYLQLMKLSLSIMVVFSSVISFLLTQGSEQYVMNRWTMIFLLFVGGMLVTGSANAINQVVEKDTDAMMKRTASRPVASGRMSVAEGWAFAIITGAAGVFILGHYFNWLAAGLAAFSLFLYAFIYTPLKKVNSIAVLVGAVPGALPADKGPSKFTALQTILYSLLLIPVTLAPFFIGMCSYENVSGIISLSLIGLANLFMIGRCLTLYRKMDVASARQVMFGSYMYLPIVMLALLLSKV